MPNLTKWASYVCPYLCQWWCSLTDKTGEIALLCNGTTDQAHCSLRGGNNRFLATGEQLTTAQLNDLISNLEKTIPDIPDISKKAISYNYESDIKVISLTWGKGYDISENHGDYILDIDSEGKIIGVELLNFKREGD